MHLTKGPTGFKGSTKIPWNTKIVYKFIVDEQWMVVEHEPTEFDYDGNLNNVYIAPQKPPSSAPEADSSVSTLSADHPAESDNTTSELEAPSGPPFPQIVADMADTVSAREGTTSAFNYVASGLGAVIHSVVGYDPINAGQVTIGCAQLVLYSSLSNTRSLCLPRIQISHLMLLRKR
jgi:Glycogen recognition site of AMP-activated protein kinase